ncbi:MAG: ribonuclease H-like domain-containing protein [Dehalococcoidales bacterium]|nr:ribonuclease H-like domain-containing protein [Dehalococcoidales bacterium]
MSKFEEIFFDVETKKLNEEVEGGWKNVPAFGMALSVTWDADNGFRTWMEEDASALVEELSQSEKIIGFNNIGFDNKVLSAYVPETQNLLNPKSFDMLSDIHKRLGFRVSLDNLCAATLGANKIADARDAVYWFREGKIDKVVEYCEKDVELTRDLYRYGQENGCILYPKYGRPVRLPVTW